MRKEQNARVHRRLFFLYSVKIKLIALFASIIFYLLLVLVMFLLHIDHPFFD